MVHQVKYFQHNTRDSCLSSQFLIFMFNVPEYNFVCHNLSVVNKNTGQQCTYRISDSVYINCDYFLVLYCG